MMMINKLEEFLAKHPVKPLVTQCCCCDKIKTYYGYKVAPEPLITEIKKTHNISHAYCPDCLKETYLELVISNRISERDIYRY